MFGRSNIGNSLYIGAFSGVLMALLLRVIEAITDVRVYTLLLNVDFIPFIGQIPWPEPIEFLFHLVISIGITFIFIHLADRLKFRDSFSNYLYLSFILCLPAICLYIPLSALAIKGVPKWNDWTAFTYWCIAHFVYIWLLPIFYIQKKRSISSR